MAHHFPASLEYKYYNTKSLQVKWSIKREAVFIDSCCPSWEKKYTKTIKSDKQIFFFKFVTIKKTLDVISDMKKDIYLIFFSQEYNFEICGNLLW